MSQEDKLAQNQHQMLSWLKFMNVGLIITLLGGFAYLVKKDALTFDDQKQKQDVIFNYPERFNDHAESDNIHMSFEEKRKLIIMEQNQKMILENQQKTTDILEKVGGDLQEIKTIVRRKN